MMAWRRLGRLVTEEGREGGKGGRGKGERGKGGRGSIVRGLQLMTVLVTMSVDGWIHVFMYDMMMMMMCRDPFPGEEGWGGGGG